MTYVSNTLNSLKKFLRKGQLLSLESTTYPGTTEEVLKPTIESLGFEIGQDFFLIYSPEREDPGNKKYSTASIPKIIGGITPICREIGIELYSKIIEKLVPVSSTRAAEITKLLENIHRAVNIGLMNELKILSDKMDIDLYEIIDAAATKPFGFTPYYPGPGLGGHCIPIDPFYLTWKAREYGMNTKFIELAGEINASMPQYVIEKIFNLLNERSKSIKNSKILVLGLSYKKNIDDIRESPSLEIIYNLLKRGAIVKYNDPFVPKLQKVRKYDLDIENINLTEKTLRSFDCVLLLTDHDEFPYELIKNNSNLILDTRGRFNLSDNIFRASNNGSPVLIIEDNCLVAIANAFVEGGLSFFLLSSCFFAFRLSNFLFFFTLVWADLDCLLLLFKSIFEFNFSSDLDALDTFFCLSRESLKMGSSINEYFINRI